MRSGRTAAIVTLSLGGVAAAVSWWLLIGDILAWEAPRIAVVPPIDGTVLPRVQVVRLRADVAARGSTDEPIVRTAPVEGHAAAPDSPALTEASAADRLLDARMDALRRRLDSLRETVRARTTGTAPPQIPLPRDVVTCGGVRARGVERVTYLIDCSARSQPHIGAMVDEVMRSVSRLDDRQSFAVIACRKDWAETAPPGAMRRGGSSFGSTVAEDLKAWLIRTATPEGPPQVYAGIQAAMALRPDLVVLVSAGLANPGDADDVRDAALGAFDRANPRDAQSGRRAARVMTLAAGGNDPMGVLSAIAAAHASDAALHGTLSAPVPATSTADLATASPTPGADSDARIVAAMRRALSDPADPASARALMEATVIAASAGWPPEHVVRMANAAARRAEALGLDELAMEANALARRTAEGSAR